MELETFLKVFSFAIEFSLHRFLVLPVALVTDRRPLQVNWLRHCTTSCYCRETIVPAEPSRLYSNRIYIVSRATCSIRAHIYVTILLQLLIINQACLAQASVKQTTSLLLSMSLHPCHDLLCLYKWRGFLKYLWPHQTLPEHDWLCHCRWLQGWLLSRLLASRGHSAFSIRAARVLSTGDSLVPGSDMTFID